MQGQGAIFATLMRGVASFTPKYRYNLAPLLLSFPARGIVSHKQKSLKALLYCPVW